MYKCKYCGSNNKNKTMRYENDDTCPTCHKEDDENWVKNGIPPRWVLERQKASPMNIRRI